VRRGCGEAEASSDTILAHSGLDGGAEDKRTRLSIDGPNCALYVGCDAEECAAIIQQSSRSTAKAPKRPRRATKVLALPFHRREPRADDRDDSARDPSLRRRTGGGSPIARERTRANCDLFPMRRVDDADVHRCVPLERSRAVRRPLRRWTTSRGVCEEAATLGLPPCRSELPTFRSTWVTRHATPRRWSIARPVLRLAGSTRLSGTPDDPTRPRSRVS